jgi:hypothetical protein
MNFLVLELILKQVTSLYLEIEKQNIFDSGSFVISM